MTYQQPPYQHPYAPPGATPPRPTAPGIAREVGKQILILLVVAGLAVVFAVALVLAAGVLHSLWWSAIPTMGFGPALLLSIIIAVTSLVFAAGTSLLKWIRTGKPDL